MATTNTFNIDDLFGTEPGAIANALPARVMRVTMENKALLVNKGQLYAGTGETVKIDIVTESGDTITYNIPVTQAVPAPSVTGSVLTYTGVGETGLQWVKP